jgi:hypothetical protein
MTGNPPGKREGRRMYEALVAVRTVMQLGSALTSVAVLKLAAGERTDIRALVRLVQWQDRFVRQHHASEDDLFWPLLRGLFPHAAASIDALGAKRKRLDAVLNTMAVAIDRIEAVAQSADSGSHRVVMVMAVAQASPAADAVRDALAEHLDAEEPVLR